MDWADERAKAIMRAILDNTLGENPSLAVCRDIIAAALRVERERCARICDNGAGELMQQTSPEAAHLAKVLAQQIRHVGQN